MPREGRDLIRKTLEDRDIAFTVSPSLPPYPLNVISRHPALPAANGSPSATRLHPRQQLQRPLGRRLDAWFVRDDDGIVRPDRRSGPWASGCR